MWDGIYADDPTAQITIENSTLRDMENGINVSLGAKLNVDNNQFIDNYNSLRIDGNINLTDVTITQNNFGISGNPLLAPHIGELPRHGIYIRNSASLEVGGFGVDEGNSFQFMENAVKIFNETTMQTIGQSPNQQLQIIPAPASFIQLKNNKFLGIHKNNSSSGDPDLGVGIYAEANSLFGGNLRLYVSDVLNPSMNTYKNFSNCEQAIRLIQASAEVFNQHISNCGIGIAALQCEGERYRINDNFFDQTYWSIIKSGDESQLGFLIANNTIVMPEDEPILIGGLAEKPEATRVCIARSVTIAPAVRESIVREGVGFSAALMTSSPSTVRETSIGSRRADGCFPVNYPFSDELLGFR
jgi:hypothetical protein